MTTGERIVAYGLIHRKANSPLHFGTADELAPAGLEELDKAPKLNPDKVVVLLGHDGETHVIFAGEHGATLLTQPSPTSMSYLMRNAAAMCDVLGQVHDGNLGLQDLITSTNATNVLGLILGEEGMEQFAEFLEKIVNKPKGKK